jgi:hypothetical protein
MAEAEDGGPVKAIINDINEAVSTPASHVYEKDFRQAAGGTGGSIGSDQQMEGGHGQDID